MKRREFIGASLAGVAGFLFGGLFRSRPARGDILDCGDVLAASGYTFVNGYTVPAGKTLRFDPTVDTTVETDANVIVRGVLEMRPNPGVTHALRFVNVNEAAFVGGDTDPTASDVGLWVEGAGRLDVQGTPKEAWNRTGSHPTWLPGDDLVLTPNAPGDYSMFAPYTGGSVATEVLNLSRNVVIEGQVNQKAHIRVRSTAPQTVNHALIRYMGPDNVNASGNLVGVAGRNPLHFHQCGDGSRGSTVTGTVIRDSHGGFVTHLSHGVTYTDCIGYDVFESPFTWPAREESHDVTYDRCVAAKVKYDPAFRGYLLAGFDLPLGRGNRCVGCVATGVQGNQDAAGFAWPEGGSGDIGGLESGVWVFQDCVAHNNKRAGLFVWQNTDNAHVIDRFTGRRNLIGINHGAYINTYNYRDVSLEGNTFGILLHALSLAPGQQLWERVSVTGSTYPLDSVKHTLSGGAVVFRDSPIPAVRINDSNGVPSKIDLVRCGLEPGNFTITKLNAGAVVRAQRADGTAFQMNPDGSHTNIPPFAA